MEELKQFGDILTLQEAAEYMKLSVYTIYIYARKGKIPAKKLGNRWRFSRISLEEFIRAGEPTGRFVSPLFIKGKGER